MTLADLINEAAGDVFHRLYPQLQLLIWTLEPSREPGRHCTARGRVPDDVREADVADIVFDWGSSLLIPADPRPSAGTVVVRGVVDQRVYVVVWGVVDRAVWRAGGQGPATSGGSRA